MKKILLVIFTIFTIYTLNAQSWVLDPGFGIGGIVHTQVGTGTSFGHAVAIQSDEKIIVAGRSYNNVEILEFVCVRYSYGESGITETVGNLLSIYPNPATEMLTIKTDSKCNIEIIDLSGKILFSTIAEDQTTINVS